MFRNRFLALILALAAIALGGCSASTTSGTPTPAATATPTPILTPPPTPGPTLPLDLSGNWTGQYSGPFNGTFVLHWNETGSALIGSIELTSPRETLQISGTFTGSSISFGAVGVVTYTGTVSSDNSVPVNISMSGSYTDIANGHTGSWSATAVQGGD